MLQTKRVEPHPINLHVMPSDSAGDQAPSPREAYIEAAWRRCREEYRLDPQAPPPTEHIGDAALKLRHEELALFERVGRMEMRRLLAQINYQSAQSSTTFMRFVLMLVDAEGAILEIFTDAANSEMARAAHMSPGFVWDERHGGVNGPGTCLHDRRSRVVHREDHFFACNRNMTCSAAPVWGANGELLGAVDASCLDCHDSRASQMPTIALVSMSARIIERLHFTHQYRDSLILHFHERAEFVGLPYDSLLAVDDNGRIVAVDSTVPGQLGFPNHAALIGRSVADRFDVSVDRLFAQAESQPFTIWPIAHGSNGQGYASLWPARKMPRTSPRDAMRITERSRRPPAAASRPRRAAATSFATIAGDDPAMIENVWRAERVMNKDIHILLLGETGTGKDTFARAIHQASDRRKEPFIVMSCAAIPESLIESELFGYEAGAFTGARAGGMRGKALAAHRGTLFLDEIGDMPLSIQARLLRLLEEKEIVPLGSSTPIPVDIRVVSATNSDLEALVSRGEFRRDLFYRLNGISLTLPALRDRADRACLIERVCREENGGGSIDIAPDAREILQAYDWPGNIRELRNTLRTAIAFAEGGMIEAVHLPRPLARGGARPPAGQTPERSALPADVAERALIVRELERRHWRIASTASALGISRNTLYRKLRRHGLLSQPG